MLLQHTHKINIILQFEIFTFFKTLFSLVLNNIGLVVPQQLVSQFKINYNLAIVFQHVSFDYSNYSHHHYFQPPQSFFFLLQK